MTSIKTPAYLSLLSLLTLSSCSSSNTTDPIDQSGGALSGKISFNSNSGDILELDLNSGVVTTRANGKDASHFTDGTSTYVNIDLLETNAAWTTKRVIVEQASDPTQYYDDTFNDPRISPDGTMVAYAGFLGAVYVVDRETGSLLRTFDEGTQYDGYERPSWTPDNKLVMSGLGEVEGIYLGDPDNPADPVRLDPDLAAPSKAIVSRDGKKLAFTLNSHVYEMNIDGTGLTQLTTSASEDRYPMFSPDGKWVVAISNGIAWFIPVNGGTPIDVFEKYPNMKTATTIVSSTGQLDWWQ